MINRYQRAKGKRLHSWRSCVLWIALGLFFLLGNHKTEAWAGAGPETAVKESEQIGLNISEFTDVDAMGFLAPDGVKPWGRIISDETEQIFLARGDTIYATFDNGHDVKPGDLFTVYQSSDSVDHPLSGRDAGYVISFLGKIVLKRQVKNGLYEGEIIESYRHIQVGYPLLPFRPVSPCVQPIDPDWHRFKSIQRGEIVLVAGKDLYEFLGQYSVVYLLQGVNSGVRRGNLFEILGPAESKKAPDLTLGYLIVLESRPESATGIVIASRREFKKGAMVWPVNLRDSLRKIAAHYDVDPGKGSIVDTLALLKKKVGSDLDLPEAFRVISRLPRCFINP